MIIVDGTPSKKDLHSFANLEDVLTDLMQEEKMENRVVTDVLVDNEVFSEIYPHQAEDIACNDISSVEVRSMPLGEMAVSMTGELGKVARMMAHGATQVARMLRNAEDTDALELFQDLLDVTRDFMGMISDLRQRYADGQLQDFADVVEKFSDLLSEMGDVMENEDWVLLADLLEYEFVPQCEQWQGMCQVLLAQVRHNLAQ